MLLRMTLHRHLLLWDAETRLSTTAPGTVETVYQVQCAHHPELRSEFGWGWFCCWPMATKCRYTIRVTIALPRQTCALLCLECEPLGKVHTVFATPKPTINSSFSASVQSFAKPPSFCTKQCFSAIIWKFYFNKRFTTRKKYILDSMTPVSILLSSCFPLACLWHILLLSQTCNSWKNFHCRLPLSRLPR